MVPIATRFGIVVADFLFTFWLALEIHFTKLVVIALVLAIPVAWYVMNKWLEDFAYRIDVSWWVFVVAGVAALLIALLTVSYQSIKTALANPVKSLRSE